MSIHITAEDARSAVKTGHVRYILAVSLVGAVIGLALVWALAA